MESPQPLWATLSSVLSPFQKQIYTLSYANREFLVFQFVPGASFSITGHR